MSDVRKRAELTTKKLSTTKLERAQHINRMQTRSFTTQIEILEHNIKKKLKVIDQEKYQVACYLKFLRSSTGTSPLSVAPKGKHDTPQIRPATAGARMRFGCARNINHYYMASGPDFAWASNHNFPQPRGGTIRSASASAENLRLSQHRSIMSRVRKVEEPLMRKHVSWIDVGNRTNHEHLTETRSQSARYHRPKPPMTTSSTQCDPDYSEPDYNLDACSSIISGGEIKKPESKPNSARKPREFKSIQPINVTFPFPITSQRNCGDITADIQTDLGPKTFIVLDKRRGLTAAVASREKMSRNKV